MARGDSCPMGGEHDPQHLTGICGGMHCTKCWQPIPVPEKASDACPSGGHHAAEEKKMGRWGQPSERRCSKCKQVF